MDAKANESSPGMSLPPRRIAIPPQEQGQEHLPRDTMDPTLLNRAAMVCQVARALAHTAEGRDAKIRELQDAVKSGTYQVPAEQIAGKMLQDTLHELL
jgi:anti-sigma28 factor (negative regulator of flagellin synthesis)